LAVGWLRTLSFFAGDKKFVMVMLRGYSYVR